MCFQKIFHCSLLRNLIFAFGLLLVTLAASCSLFWNLILEYAVEKVQELVLSSSSKSFSLWVENPIPFYIDFYFFNWTNPNDLKLPDYKPKLEEVGPYRFREEIKKTGIEWNENKTVTYKKLRRWYFEPGESCGNLNDVITSVNVIALTSARATRYWNRMARIPLSVTLSTTQKMAITKSVREFLFEGFADPLIEFASKIPGLSSRVPFVKFGWFYKRNDSSEFDGVFNVETGANGLGVLGKLKFWNFNNRTSFYEDRCGYVEGSAGDFWPPERPRADKIALFSPDMCRYINFIYSKRDTVGGVAGYRYDSGPSLFDNGTTDPENKCFCGGRCFPSGVVNVSSCRFGAPAFVSYPHFYSADSFYLNSVEGLKPESRKHEMYIILEQVWAIPLEIAIRLQINILIEPDSGIRMLDGVPTILFPTLWFEQKVTIPEHLRREIQLLLEIPRLGFIVSVTFYVVGFSCIVISVLSICLRRKKEKRPPMSVKRAVKSSSTKRNSENAESD